MNPIKKNQNAEVTVEAVKPVEEKTIEDKKEDILKEAITKVTEIEKEADYTVIVQALNVRKTTSLNADRVGLVHSGDILTVKEDNYTQAGWKKVVKPFNGYVKSEFIAKKKG